MKPNPGGQLAPEEILGRDDLIEELWDILDGRNSYMNDLRRIGKTMILRKMEAEPREGWLVLKRDLGGIKTAAEFTTQVYRDALNKLGTKKRGLRRMGDLLGSSCWLTDCWHPHASGWHGGSMEGSTDANFR